MDLREFGQTWEVEYIKSRVELVTEAVKRKDYESALDYLSMIQDKAKAAECTIKSMQLYKDEKAKYEYRIGDKINVSVTAVNHIGDYSKKIVYTFKDGKYLYKWSTTKVLEMSNGRQYNLNGTVESVDGNIVKLKRCVYTLIKGDK